ERVVGGSSRGSPVMAGSMPMAASVRGRRSRRDQARDGITGSPAVTSSTCTGDDVPMVPEALGPPPSASGPTSTPDAGRRMDEDTPSRRSRATAGASALGAAALLVLSFGPSALALSPASPTPQPL